MSNFTNYYDKDGRYAGYSSNSDSLDSLSSGPLWLLPVILGVWFFILFVLPVIALFIIGLL